ncbi:MAG: hypothetical protein R3F31_06170 [Verrucomicrobiales bacterium]
MLIAGGGVLGTYSGGFSQDQTYAFADYTGAAPSSRRQWGRWFRQRSLDLMSGWQKAKGLRKLRRLPSGQWFGDGWSIPPLVGPNMGCGGTKRLAAILQRPSRARSRSGQSYNTPNLMPAWNTLSDEKLAQVATYIRRSFGKLPEGERSRHHRNDEIGP